jgi:cell division GTPase FtsZ
VDFADVRTIMGDAGTALMGIGRGSGELDSLSAVLCYALLYCAELYLRTKWTALREI